MTREEALKIFKSLADTSRLRIVQSLTKGEMYTELLAQRLGITPSTVSFHMKKLEDAGLVVSRKEQYYEDYCAIRRDMIGEGILRRDGSEYVRMK
jgi:DNA-binding transcriptional ArsR family regulator